MKFNVNLKKAAMFGLDARIALAIFGALSVISGVALYSAIKHAQIVAVNTEFQEIIKASEQYYLDIGEKLEIEDTNVWRLYTGDLVQNRQNLKNWNGPYLNFRIYNSAHVKNLITDAIGTTGLMAIFLQQGSNWSAIPDDLSVDEICTVGNSDCYEWVVAGAQVTEDTVKVKKLFKDLDSFVDNGDGETKGIVRYNNLGNGQLMYRSFQHKL